MSNGKFFSQGGPVTSSLRFYLVMRMYALTKRANLSQMKRAKRGQSLKNGVLFDILSGLIWLHQRFPKFMNSYRQRADTNINATIA